MKAHVFWFFLACVVILILFQKDPHAKRKKKKVVREDPKFADEVHDELQLVRSEPRKVHIQNDTDQYWNVDWDTHRVVLSSTPLSFYLEEVQVLKHGKELTRYSTLQPIRTSPYPMSKIRVGVRYEATPDLWKVAPLEVFFASGDMDTSVFRDNPNVGYTGQLHLSKESQIVPTLFHVESSNTIRFPALGNTLQCVLPQETAGVFRISFFSK